MEGDPMIIVHPNISGHITIPPGTKKMFIHCVHGSMSITVPKDIGSTIHQIGTNTELQVDDFVGNTIDFVAGENGASFDVRSKR